MPLPDLEVRWHHRLPAYIERGEHAITPLGQTRLKISQMLDERMYLATSTPPSPDQIEATRVWVSMQYPGVEQLVVYIIGQPHVSLMP